MSHYSLFLLKSGIDMGKKNEYFTHRRFNVGKIENIRPWELLRNKLDKVIAERLLSMFIVDF